MLNVMYVGCLNILETSRVNSLKAEMGGKWEPESRWVSQQLVKNRFDVLSFFGMSVGPEDPQPDLLSMW